MSQQLAIDFNKVATIETEKVNRMIRYRVLAGTRGRANKIAGTAGAVRFVWNKLIERNKQAYKQYKEMVKKGEDAESPSTNYESFSKEYLAIKAEFPWLSEYTSYVRASAAKPLSVAFKNKFNGIGGFPKFKGRRGDDSFVYDFTGTKKAMEDLSKNVLNIPRVGKVTIRRRGGDPYRGCTPKAIRIKQECGKWYAYLCYEITIPKVMDKDLKMAIGIDMNVVNQCAMSNGEIVKSLSVEKYEARRKRYQRRLSHQKKGSKRRGRTKEKLAKTARKIKNVRDTHNHTISHLIAKNADVVVVEDLNVKGMTAKAKGKGKAQKSGLNKGILKNAWGDLRRMLEYKANRLQAVNPAYTSQACSECGHVAKSNRKSQSQFHCNECGHKENADVNAAKNVLFLGMKEITASVSGASGRARGVPEVKDPNDPSIDIFGSKLIPISHRFL